jgi:hypothetical protein
MPDSSITRTSRAVSAARLSSSHVPCWRWCTTRCRSAFQILSRNAGQGHTANLIASRFPSFARHTQHGALSRSGIADDDPHIAPVRDTRQRLDLLSRKHETARSRARQHRLFQIMAFLFRHEFSGAKQALFGLDHVARGEAVLAASVLAEFDKIGRATDCAHHGVELLDAVAVPMREDRHVTARERRFACA